MFASGILSSMDLSGQTLLEDFDATPRHVRIVICEDFVRVGEAIRVGVGVGSHGQIRLKVPEFEWPDRDAYRYHEQRMERPVAGALKSAEGGTSESSGTTTPA